ncbi:MAG: hypothetical protein ACRDQE_09230, partial [Gaiellales bacterium]
MIGGERRGDAPIDQDTPLVEEALRLHCDGGGRLASRHRATPDSRRCRARHSVSSAIAVSFLAGAC